MSAPEPTPRLTSALGSLIVPVYIPAFMAQLGEAMLIPILPIHLRELGFSYTVVTLVIGAIGIGMLVMQLPAGSMLARSGDRRTMAWGVSLVGLGGLLVATTDNAVLLWFFRCAAGAGGALWILSRQAYVMRTVEGTVRGRALALFGGVTRSSILVGPLISGVVASRFGTRTAIVVAGLTGLSALLTLPAAGSEARIETTPGTTGDVGYRSLARTHRRELVLVGLAQLGSMAVRTGRLAILPLVAEAQGLDPAQVGIIVALSAALDLVLFPVSGQLMDRKGRLYAIVPAFTIMGFGLMLLPLADSFATLAAVGVIVGLGNGLGSGSMLTVGTDLAPPEDPGRFLALLGQVRSGGSLVGPVVIGVAADAVGLDPASVIIGTVGVATASMFAVAVGETHPDHRRPGLTPRSRTPR